MQGCQFHGLSSLGEASGESLLWIWIGFPSEALLPALTSGTSWGWGLPGGKAHLGVGLTWNPGSASQTPQRKGTQPAFGI